MVIQFPIVQLNRSIFWNGKIEQWGINSGSSGSQNIYVDFDIYFTQSDYNINALIYRETANGETVTYFDVGSNQMRLRTSANQRTVKWYVKGY